MWKATIRTSGTLWSNPKITREVRDAMKITAKYAEKIIIQDTPVDTGEMRRKMRVISGDRTLLFVNTANHAGFIEYGTRFITPRRPIGKNLDKIGKYFKETLVGLLIEKVENEGRGTSMLKQAEGLKGKVKSLSHTYPKKV